MVMTCSVRQGEGFAVSFSNREVTAWGGLALFKQMTGQWPTKDYFDTEAKPVTKEVMGKIKSMNIAYSHSLKARAKQVVAQPTPPVPFIGNGDQLPWEDARGN